MTSSVLRPSRPRRLVPAMAIAGVVVALSGCQVFSPVQTEKIADVTDGVSVNLGAVQVRNLVIVSDKKGGPGTISGAVQNSSSSAQTVSFTLGTETTETTVDPYAEVNLSSGSGQVTLTSIPVQPGETANVLVSTPSSGQNPVQVPVLLPNRYYSSYAPTSG